MNDIVPIFETQATTKGWKFSYGNSANNNLLASDQITDQIYLLLDPVTRNPIPSEFGGVSGYTFSGQFMLLVKSSLDNVYHNQKDQPKAQGRYEKNIAPLLDEAMSLHSVFGCTDYEITKWSMIDAINVLDANHDGVVVTFGFRIIE